MVKKNLKGHQLVHVNLPKETVDALDKLADADCETRSTIIRRAVNKFLEEK